MALPAGFWYTRDTGTLGYSAVIIWTTGASIPPGTLRSQTAPATGSERVFVAIQSATGTTGGVEPTWVVTKGATTADNTVTWMEATGQAGMNGDRTNCPNWTAASTNVIAAGYVIKNNAGTFLFICTTGGTAGSGAEPTWNTTAGLTTADNTVTWTSIGAVGNFGQWAAPHARLANAFASTWSAAGDTIYIGSDHAETASLSGLTSQGTAVAPILVFSVPTGTIPPVAVAAGASITFVSGNISIFNASNSAFIYGCSFIVNGTLLYGTAVANLGLYFESCTFQITSASSILFFGIGAISSGNSSHRFNFRSCTFIVANTAQSVRFTSGLTDFIGCTFYPTGTVPTIAFTCTGGQMGSFRVRDCDISNLAGTLVNVAGASSGDISFENCAIGAGVALTTGTQSGQGGTQVRLWNCDSSATNYSFAWANYMGTAQDSTLVYRSGGASDGTTPISWQIASTVNDEPLLPLVSQEIFTWNSFKGIAKTATIRLTSASTLTNADVWIELEYSGSAASPLGTSTFTRSALLASGSTLTTDVTSTWVGGLGHNYQIATNFTPQLAGIVKCRLNVGKPSVTLNLDPLITIS